MQRKAVLMLEKEYKGAGYYLNFKTPLELMVAAILSAQARDDAVNKATPALFSRYRSAGEYAAEKPEVLAKYINGITFSSAKARNIIKACKVLVERHEGRVPRRMDELTELPGIGRKTANTILINAFGIVEGIPVDTWVIKLSNRIGLSLDTEPDRIEEDLKQIVEKGGWRNIAYVFKAHGREICKSQVPLCSRCMLNSFCPRNNVEKSG